MRLTCPNCSARYEVDEALLPPGGRDVQCSNCSQTWFQPGARRADPPPAPVPVPEPEAAAPAEPHESAPRSSEVTVAETGGASGSEAQAATPQPARRQIDPNVADILREEAEREARLRRGDPAPVSQQEEMALASGSRITSEQRLAELEGATDAFDVDEIAANVATAASRREQFPDIEEINSTLRATGDRKAGEANATDVHTIGTAERRRSAVRRGFLLMILLAAIAAGAYAYAGQIADALPQAGPYLERYVSMVNDARFWLDDLARSLVSTTEG